MVPNWDGQLDTSADAVYTTLPRADKTVDQRLPRHSGQAPLRSLGDARLKDLVSTYVAAWERDDVDAIVALLAEDAIVAITAFVGAELQPFGVPA